MTKRSMLLATIALAGVLAMGLASCGGAQQGSDSAASSAASSEAAVASSEAGSAASSSADASADASSESRSAESDESGSSSTASYTPGIISDGSYTNQFFGFKFSAPEGWATLGADVLKETLGDASSSVEFVANSAEGDNVNVMADTTEVALQGATDSNAYVAAALDPVKAALESQGAEGVSATTGTASLVDQEYPCIELEFTLQDIPVKQRTIIVEKGGYTSVVTITAVSMEPDELLQLFTKA